MGQTDIVSSFLPPFQGYGILLPIALLLIAAFWALFANLLPGKDRGASLVGLACSVLATLCYGFSVPGALLFGGRYFFTPDARFAAVIICLLAALWCLWTFGSGQNGGLGRTREAVAFAMLSAIGAVIAVAATDIIVIILALELATMPSYVLVGYRRYRIKGLEGAMKYFLLSVLTTLIMLYGASFLVGLSASTTFAGLASLSNNALTLIAVGMVVLGMFAKMSAAPFHWWAPDAYEGAESWALSFAAVVPKVAVTVVLARLIFIISQPVPQVAEMLMVMAIFSMIVGSFAALMQVNIRRMMAYSGVSSAGFILLVIAMMAMGLDGSLFALNAAILYVAAAAFATMGVLFISAHEGSMVADLNGLSERRPGAAWALAIIAVSMIGVPPTLGFFAKLNVFLITAAAQQYALLVFAVVMVVVSAFYYIRLIRASFFGESQKKTTVVTDALDAEKEGMADSQNLAAEIEATFTDADIEPATSYPAKTSYSPCAVAAIVLIVVVLMAAGIFHNPIMTFLAGS
ncbi:MAG: hypothetical protein FWC81_01610 [Coriobacteriia bacterium]|nr:hypothetical protein [Coriobacteriia bacterium]